jgi:choline dehydrogenase
MGFISNSLLLLASTSLIAPILAQETYDYIVVGSGKHTSRLARYDVLIPSQALVVAL